MSRNLIQLQPGLSLTEFIRLHGIRKLCESAGEPHAGQLVSIVHIVNILDTIMEQFDDFLVFFFR